MSLSATCHKLSKLSLGLTVEQQALGKAAAIGHGFTEEQVANAVFTPIWQYQILYMKEYVAEYSGDTYIGPNNTGIFTIDIHTGLGFGDPPVYEPAPVLDCRVSIPGLAYDIVRTATGPNAMNEFMAQYNALASLADQGLALWKEEFDRIGTQQHAIPNCGGGAVSVTDYGEGFILPVSGGTHFSFTACSLVAQQLHYKIYGSRQPHMLIGSVCPNNPNGYVSAESGQPPAVYFLDYPPAQKQIMDLTKCFFGIHQWTFTDDEGNSQTVAAGSCPVLPTFDSENIPPGFTIEPGDDEIVCDYTPFIPPTPPVTIPFPRDPSSGLEGPSLGGGDPILFDPVAILINGTKGPIYPQYEGALAYDLLLKKWGKTKLQYLALLDLSPINTDQGKIIATQRFGPLASAYMPTGYIHRLDAFPEDSYLKYGKIGMNRIGFTTLEEVRVTFRLAGSGTITVASSLDGKNPEVGMTKVQTYTDATWCTMGVGASGRWHTVKISGVFDITHLEYTGYAAGRR